MKILITGTSSGLGAELASRLHHCDLTVSTRSVLDLSNIKNVIDYEFDFQDMLINCAGTDIGGKIDFVNHQCNDVATIMTTNLLSPMILTSKALKINPACKIVNITSTNNNRYYPKNLAYSLSKQSLSTFGSMLKVEYPDVSLLEVKLGLTKTNFNHNRYAAYPERFSDIYSLPHLTVKQAADQILAVLFDNTVKLIEVSP